MDLASSVTTTEEMLDYTAIVYKYCATWFMLSSILQYGEPFKRTVCPQGGESQMENSKIRLAAVKQPLHADSDRPKSITKAMGAFTAKDVRDVQPYAVMGGGTISAYD